MINDNILEGAGQEFRCKCLLCKDNFDHGESLGKFKSSVTGTSFCNIVRNDDNLPPCKLDCVIYLITCSNCKDKFQYVGKTKNILRTRVANHRSDCKSKKNITLYNHFNKGCDFKDAKFRIIERTNEVDLLDREKFWINKIMSLYPFGLNEQISGIGNMTSQNLIEFNFVDPYFSYPEARRPRSHGIRHNNRNNRKNRHFDIEEVANNLKIVYFQGSIKKFIDAVKGATNKLLLGILQYVLLNRLQFKRRFVDIVAAYVGHSRKYTKESKTNESKIRVKLEYSSKLLDIINISGIISSKDVKSKIPDEYENCNIEVINRYNKPIGSRICNYSKVLNNLSDGDIINDNGPCICEIEGDQFNIRDFIYSPAGHVVTGNLNIVDKFGNFDQLKKVLKFGYKYRIQRQNVTWRKIIRDLMMVVEDLKNKITKSNKGNIADLNEWE